jgi:hypothetical protein
MADLSQVKQLSAGDAWASMEQILSDLAKEKLQTAGTLSPGNSLTLYSTITCRQRYLEM